MDVSGGRTRRITERARRLMQAIGIRFAAEGQPERDRERETRSPAWLEELDDYKQEEVLALPPDSEVDEVLEARKGGAEDD